MGGRVQGRAKPRCAGADLKPHILTKSGRFRFIGHNIAKPDSPCDSNAVQGTPGDPSGPRLTSGGRPEPTQRGRFWGFQIQKVESTS